MIETTIFGCLLFLGVMSLLLAVLAARQSQQSSAEWDRAPDSATGTEAAIPDSELASFSRNIEDHAPALLQHLVRYRRTLGPNGLKALIASFAETPGMEVRKQMLASFAPFYTRTAPDCDDLGDLIGELREAASEPRWQELHEEIERVSPAQLALHRLINGLFEASSVAVKRWRKRLAALRKETPEVAAGQDIDQHFSELFETLLQTVDELSKTLPLYNITDKTQRRKKATEGLRLLGQRIEIYLRETPPWIRSLPEGALTEKCFRRLFDGMTVLLVNSGGKARAFPEGLNHAGSAETAGSGTRPFSLATASLLLLTILFFAGAGFVRYGTLPHRFNTEKTIESTVYVESATGTGSGFLVRGHRLIVTNHHVVDSDTVVVVNVKRRGDAYGSPRALNAAVVATDRKNDMAILAIAEEVELAALPVGLEMARSPVFEPGQTVHVVGNPLKMKDIYVQGQVSAVEADGAWIDITIAPGNSGGPVCDTRGVVIGVMTRKWNEENGNFSMGFAFPPAAAWQLIEGLR